MGDKIHIEELFREKFEGYKAQPSASAWKKVQRAYSRRQFLRFNPRRINIYYTIGAILIGTAVAITQFTNNENNITKPETTQFPITISISPFRHE